METQTNMNEANSGGFKDAIPGQTGVWTLEAFKGDIVRDENGNIINEREVIPEWGDHTFVGKNLIVTNGKNLLLDRLFALGSPPAAVQACGVGNSATAATTADTQLGGSTPSPVLQAFDSTPTRSGQVVTCVTTFATGTANQVWQELGLFNGTVNGTSTMFNRIAPIGPFTKTSSVSIVVTVQITQS